MDPRDKPEDDIFGARVSSRWCSVQPMIIELGHFAVVLALAAAVVQMLLPAWGARVGDVRLMQVAEPAALTQLALLAFAFAALTYAYVTSDFSVENVWANSHSAKPLLYKISGVWGNHEGSMLLWVLILALFGAAVALFGSNLPATLRANVLATQAAIAVAFLLFIVFASNPFARIPLQPEGRGLNPILQDAALAIHPPFLYAGYVGLSMAFSFAIAALIEGRTDAAWARWVRPWTLAAWVCLTLGIALGSWWAYYELGWGGWWFWDPVENASFMPWLAATALLHSALVMEKREALKVWTILLAILAFSLSLVGTFLVRSGVLTSVHAFAVDPARGVFILAILVVLIGGALALYARRAPQLQQGGLFAPISREGALVLNNVLLTVACGTVFVGTLYPLALEAITGDKISVGPPYFNFTFVPLMLPLLLAVPLGPLLAWKRADVVAALQRLFFAALVTLAAFTLALAFYWRGPWLAPFGIALGVWVIAGAVTDWAGRVKLFSGPLSDSLHRARGLPRAAYGTALAHAGVGLAVIGIVATTAWQQEAVLSMHPGETAEIAGYELTFRGVAPARGANYQDQVGLLSVARGGSPVTELTPAKRTYDAPRQTTTEAAIHVSWRGDLYAVLGDELAGGGYVVRLYFNPLVRLIWLGALVMALGGVLSLSDRRLRVGAPGRARRRPAPASVGWVER
jgi:cytochrome c-type biogenesis protein CcmF